MRHTQVLRNHTLLPFNVDMFQHKEASLQCNPWLLTCAVSTSINKQSKEQKPTHLKPLISIATAVVEQYLACSASD
jgi:hypothetical protein